MKMLSNDPLHGITLEMILTRLVECYGWDELGKNIRIRCFNYNPSIKSSLKFLRRTPWARKKVEDVYMRMMDDGEGCEACPKGIEKSGGVGEKVSMDNSKPTKSLFCAG